MLFPIKYFYIYIYIYIYKLTLIKGVLCSNFQYKIADILVHVLHWGQLHSNVIHYNYFAIFMITLRLHQFSNVIDYITITL
jgi:hypothetical protein